LASTFSLVSDGRWSAGEDIGAGKLITGGDIKDLNVFFVLMSGYLVGI
jgi:hypothetical protein